MTGEDDRLAHPPALRLEAVAAGEAPGAIGEHLAACAACAAEVERLRSEAAAFRANVDPRAFAEAVRARARRQERRSAKVVWLIAPALAAAAAIALWVRAPQPVTSTVDGPSSGELGRFKGGLSVTVVRDRAGRQERLTGPLEVEPSDRIRVEVAVDHEGPVAAGLLAEDGTWTPLLAPASLGPGTHYSELAARFDDSPTNAVLLVGEAAAVERARATRNFEGVVAWRVRSRAPR